MSRVGKSPIEIPSGVTVTVDGGVVRTKGPKGELQAEIASGIEVSVEGSVLTVARGSETKEIRSLHGTTRALIANMVKGVTEGFLRNLDIIGVGYGAELKGTKLVLKLRTRSSTTLRRA